MYIGSLIIGRNHSLYISILSRLYVELLSDCQRPLYYFHAILMSLLL